MPMIGLMDVNNFFVSCERLFRPDLERKPVAVLSSNDGCIVARSNEVKAMGVPMGIPLFQAKQLVDMSSVTLFSSNFTLYRDISRRVMEVLLSEVGACEQYSIDEAFFIVTNTSNETEMARLRTAIVEKTGIPVSIGVAPTKTLAKVAAGIAKKDNGSKLLSLVEWQKKASTVSTQDIWNLGRATAARLREQGVTTAAEFMALDRAWVAKQFGVGGCRLFDELSGRAVYEVNSNNREQRQSLTSSRSFAESTSNINDLKSAVAYHVEQIAKKLRQQDLVASRLYVSLRASRHGDFAYQGGTEEVALDQPSSETRSLLRLAMRACETLYKAGVPYKKAGVVAAGLLPSQFLQPSLLSLPPMEPVNALDEITDQLNSRFGAGSIRSGIIQKNGSRTSSLQRSQSYTTVWKDIPKVQA